MLRNLRTWPRIAIVACYLFLACTAARAGDWKVETRVYHGTDSRKPASTSTTYYHAGVYYDASGEPPQVTIVDPEAEQITVFDMGRRVKTDIKSGDLAKLAARFEAAAAKSSNDVARFAATNKFVPEFRGVNRLVLDGELLTYRVDCTKANDAGAATEYGVFSDWCARLNSVHPDHLPASPRLAVNKELSSRGMVPSGVWLTLQYGKPKGDVTLRSEHEYTWSLTRKDLDRIGAIKAMASECESVSFATYLGYDAARGSSRKQVSSDATK